MDQEDSAALQQQQQQQDEDAGSAAAAAPAAPPPEREWLIADKQQVLLDELLAMGVMRQELVDILADMGQEAAEDETLVSEPGASGAKWPRGGALLWLRGRLGDRLVSASGQFSRHHFLLTEQKLWPSSLACLR
jgi:hypothetical protein